MGNENEVKRVADGSEFLPDEIVDLEAIQDVYNLEDEFDKTRKNRNLTLYASILFLILFVVGGTWAFTAYLNEKNREFDVNIKDFEDLRLKEVIESASSQENTLTIQKTEFEILLVNQKSEILDTNKNYFRQEIKLLATDLPDKKISSGIAKIRWERNKKIKQIREKYGERIKIKRNRIIEMERDLEKKRREKEERTKLGYALVNENRLNELKMKKLKKNQKSAISTMKEYLKKQERYLTQKYNPVFPSGKFSEIVYSDSGDSSKKYYFSDLKTIVDKNNIIGNFDFDVLRTNITDFFFVLHRLNNLEYRNATSSALSKLDTLSNAIIFDYETIWSKSATILMELNTKLLNLEKQVEKNNQVIMKQNSLINRQTRAIRNYHFAIDHVLTEESENGFVISARDKKNIYVHLDPLYVSKNLRFALVFRNDDEYIGRIKLYKTKYDVRGRVISLRKNRQIKPFDKILLELN